MLDIDIVVGAYSLAAGVTTTALQIIAAATNKAKAGMIPRDGHKEGIGISFQGISPTDAPVRLRIMRQTTAIGGTPTTVTPVKHKAGEDGTIQTTAKKKANSGDAEPTYGDVYYDRYLHPQGSYELPRQFNIEQGDRLGFVFDAPNIVLVSISVPAME